MTYLESWLSLKTDNLIVLDDIIIFLLISVYKLVFKSKLYTRNRIYSLRSFWYQTNILSNEDILVR